MKNFFVEHPFIAGFITLSAVGKIMHGLVQISAIRKGTPYREVVPYTTINLTPKDNDISEVDSRQEQE